MNHTTKQGLQGCPFTRVCRMQWLTSGVQLRALSCACSTADAWMPAHSSPNTPKKASTSTVVPRPARQRELLLVPSLALPGTQASQASLPHGSGSKTA